MRFALLVIAILIATASLAVADNCHPTAGSRSGDDSAQEDRPTCENCGMFWDVSPTAVEVTIEVEDETLTHRFECLGCLHDYVLENYEEVTPKTLSIIDYSTFGTDDVQMIDAFKAQFLFGTERLKGSMPPFTAAFASKDAAEAAQEDLGGELVDFKGMHELMMEFKGVDEEAAAEVHGHEGHAHDSDAQDEEVYVCSCAGGCCDHIREDSPGKCPQCGMTLVKESEK